MQPTLIPLILLSVLLAAGSQILLKFGMASPEIANALTSKDGILLIALMIATSPFIIVGLSCFGLSAIVWLFVLSKIPLSTAYPFVALGIVITVVAGRLIFGELISPVKAAGVCLIVIGVSAVAVGS
jgi:multidrug transporter EmrE-like cation transporter